MREAIDGKQASLTADEALRIELAVKDRLIDYWWDVDCNGARTALEFYTADCVYRMCGHRMAGHAAVKAYYDYREARGERLVRHVLTNLRAHARTQDLASVRGVLCVYAADGVPVLPSAPPILVADTAGEFVRDASGVWKLRSHEIVPLFRGGVEVLAPPGASGA